MLGRNGTFILIWELLILIRLPFDGSSGYIASLCDNKTNTIEMR